jgi:uncharacterized repeat protein (TIGR01451 family)
MKPRFYTIFLLLLASAYSTNAQVLRSFTPRYSNPSVRGNIVYVSNNIITSNGTITTEVAPGGTATNNGGAAEYIDIDGTPPVSYIPFGSGWSYWANNSRPVNWHTIGFAFGAWPVANGELGYGDGDETTCIPSGGGGTLCAPTGTKRITAYFRKTVAIANPAIHSNFTMNVKRDDGVAVYVNGIEVYRDNLPAGGLAHGTLATAAAGDDGYGIQTVTLPITAFAAGNNYIAVEIHQNDNASSDLSFDFELRGNPITTATIFPYGSSWKYLANNTRPANWETTGFADGAWSTGNSQLGYGDGDEATCVPSGGAGTLCLPTGNKYITSYFRKAVNIINPGSYAYFILNLVRDDGAIVYVNGTEVVRSNMPAGAIGHATLAPGTVSGAQESAPYPYIVPSSYFVNGSNTIAVEVHQDDIASSDISFNMELLGSTDPTFCSSSADLNLTSCTNVLWAGLYWGATQGTDGTNTGWINGETNIQIKTPGSAVFQTVASSQTDYHNNTLVPGLPHTGYRCFADITALINTGNPDGTYTIANMVGPAGIDNGAGGWTIVIAYADPATIVRNLTVFDGSVIMNGGDPALHVPITGFLTPPAGPVSCELGAVVYDGDRNQTDEFSFKQNLNPAIGVYTNMTPNATGNLDDMWNSTISYKGAVVTTRSPAHQNTLGYDADIIDVPNVANAVLGNNQTSASIRFSSPSENYMIQVVSTAVSQYTPSFNLSKSSLDVNGGLLVPGDELRYRVDYQNGGNDASTATRITDNMPVGTSYKPGSLRINGVAKTDAAGDDEAEFDFITNRVVFRLGTGANPTIGGEVAASGSGNVTFEVYTANSCAVLSCGNLISNQARINYDGKISLLSLYDSSGVIVGGCNEPGPFTNTVGGTCSPLGDTLITNICPSLSVTLPVARYAGYQFYTAAPFTLATIYNPATPITYTRTLYAFYDGAGACNDTIRINISITACPDIDDDNDGIPDYVEIDNPLALLDDDSDGTPNWNDNTYPLYVDNNIDGFNDNFDPSADSDNDGVPNFNDSNFPGYTDTNADGINDNMDKDLDGIPNHLDLDSDNDGIPDVTESGGVDANGDGRIDNYTDADNDGLAQNVDGSSGGVGGSGEGLGALDTDSDGVPNYLDLDSDNDGIPDIIEVYGVDVNNNGRIDGFTDNDFDGLSDNIDGDVGNDGTAENAANTLLRTGTDTDGDGRANTYPYKNMDNDSKTNPYDLDSDGDGITDVKEAFFADVDWNGRVDGMYNANGWSTTIAALSSLGMPNNDATGSVNVYDIDSDDDGIPDNIEGQATSTYTLPSLADTDNDGIANSYDNFGGFGGDGIHVLNTDGDGMPDYLDADTDNDGLTDIIEGNDFNLNAEPDDNVSLTGSDSDDDGLDDRFDNNNSSARGTSAYMGTGGSTTGDSPPGSFTMVQQSAMSLLAGCGTERDWRCLGFILNCQIITFKGLSQGQMVRLDWTVLCRQEVAHFIVERSTDNLIFNAIGTVAGRPVVNEIDSYHGTDDISLLNGDVVYYRLKTVMHDGKTYTSNSISIRRDSRKNTVVQIFPNPVRDQLQVSVTAATGLAAQFYLLDGNGKLVKKYTENILPGSNTFTYSETRNLPNGVYYLRVNLGEQPVTHKFSILK